MSIENNSKSSNTENLKNLISNEIPRRITQTRRFYNRMIRDYKLEHKHGLAVYRDLDKWKYENFKEYLIAISKGQEYLSHLEDFPRMLNLNETWIQTFIQLKSGTVHDGKERYALIATNPENRKVYLPKLPAQGNELKVPGKTISIEHQLAEKQGLKVIGDIHSHPHEQAAVFSVADLYRVVNSNPLSVIGVIEGNEVLFAFRTHETAKLPIVENSQMDFEKEWYNNNGFKYSDESYETRVLQTRFLPTPHFEINKQIAEKYKLVLYIGTLGDDLYKIQN